MVERSKVKVLGEEVIDPEEEKKIVLTEKGQNIDIDQVKTVVTADGMTRVQLRQSMVLQMVMQQDLQIFIQDSHGLNG